MTKDDILAELRLSRIAIATDVAAVRRELDFKAKLSDVVRKKPFAWFGGAAALGWWLAGPKSRTRVVTKMVDAKGKRIKTAAPKAAKSAGWFGFLFTILKFAFPYLRPALSSYAIRQMSQWTQRASH